MVVTVSKDYRNIIEGLQVRIWFERTSWCFGAGPPVFLFGSVPCLLAVSGGIR